MEELIIPFTKFPILMNIYSPVNLRKSNFLDSNTKSDKEETFPNPFILKSYPLYTKKEKKILSRSNSWCYS